MSQKSRPESRSTASSSSTIQAKDGPRDSSSRDENEPKGGNDMIKEWKRSTPLPAVKGTIGGIESPKRGHFASSSISSTVRDLLTPSTASFPSQQPTSPSESNDQSASPTPTFVPNPNAPIFRSDSTVRSTFDGLPLEAKGELKRLFMVS